MKKIPLTPMQENQMKTLYVDSKMSAAKISAIMGLSPGVIRRNLNRMGVGRTLKEAAELREAHKQEAIKSGVYLYFAGATMGKAAEMVGVSLGAISQHANKMNMKRPRTPRKKYRQETIKEIGRLAYDPEWTQKEIAKEKGMTEWEVLFFVKKYAEMLSLPLTPRETRVVSKITEAQRMRKEGEKNVTIAAALGVSARMVSAYIHQPTRFKAWRKHSGGDS